MYKRFQFFIFLTTYYKLFFVIFFKNYCETLYYLYGTKECKVDFKQI